MRPKTISEKILSTKSGTDSYAGQIVICDVDVMMAHDANGPLAVKSFQRMGTSKVCNPERIHFFMDHGAPAPNETIANLHQLMRQFAKDNGIDFHEPGEGVCHQLMIEKGYVHAGDLVVGTDSHTCTYGAVGAFSTGIGASDMGICFATGKNWFRIPETIKVVFDGELAGNCSAKDVILYLIGQIKSDGGNYEAFEFYGDYIEKCTLSDRMTICNMVVEMGGKACFTCIKDLGISADDGAQYVKTIHIDVSKIEPGVAKPHFVDSYSTVKENEGIPFQLALLGSCTNGRIEDLRIAADILKNKKIADGVRLIVIPASSNVLLQAMEEGVAEDLIKAGAVFVTPGCAACVGTHGGIPADGETVISTANRNFKGRMGNNKALIYLVSPRTLAVSCLAGRLTVPTV